MMKSSWTRVRTLLLLCLLCPVAGCLQEDSVTVTKDGLVSFEAIVTEPDEQKKIEFPAFEKVITTILDDLQQHTWKATAKWMSKERPYLVKVTGSAKLPEVVGKTGIYNLSKVDDKKFKLFFNSGDNSKVRVVFNSPAGGAQFLDAGGKPVHEIESATAQDVVTIVLP